MPLSTKIRQQYKAQAHKLKPVVTIGNKGLSESVKKEINLAVEAHELIKIRIQCSDRDERQQLFNEICLCAQAEPVQLIGSIGVIFRKRKAGKSGVKAGSSISIAQKKRSSISVSHKRKPI